MAAKYTKSIVFCLIALIAALPGELKAQATLLLEEPYSYDGTFAGTGHAAIYLARVCAATPTTLRRCQPGESGVVVSRYHHVGGRDWIAVPLIPYLYAVKDAASIPLFADAKLVEFLRHNYLQENMSEEARDMGPRAPSNQLAGSAYDRTTYGFRFATGPDQDDELIRILNSEPNSEAYALLNRNCADFAKQILNFYYPHASHRSIIADLGVTTPKQIAKSLVRSAKHHPEMQLTTFVIPQVPGLKRSKPVHGVVESLVLAKKYVTPVLLFHPFVVGTVEAAYWAGWRFNPTKGALIFDADNAHTWHRLDLPLTNAERRSYQEELASLKRDVRQDGVPGWREFQASAQPEIDGEGQTFLRGDVNGEPVRIGICRDNALRMNAPPEILQDLVLTRLEQELKPKPARASKRQVEQDFSLLQRALDERKAELGH
ncbi:MAG: hypothetical protein DMG96_07485 [Acidobacteria bacterium]|nr:MAG: hypothetical protein DMG98_09160 [Acidobacteriota bacterium]PYV78524.1 MAG: hypothetical protein DMG96_07485 [Acidobacteriota bacterium]